MFFYPKTKIKFAGVHEIYLFLRHLKFCLISSAVEQLIRNQQVGGSNPL